jgi:uncharacterized Ntn-hydrolase superfamily protein
VSGTLRTLPGAAALALAALLGVVVAATAPVPASAQEADTLADTLDGPADPSVAADRAGHRAFLGGYAMLAYDPGARQLGIVAASGGFSAGSGLPHLEQGTGAVAVLGRLAPGAGRTTLEALRRGQSPAAAVERAVGEAGGAGGLQVAALTPACESAVRTARDAYPWSGSRSGVTGQVCWLAVGSLLSDSGVLQGGVRAFTDAEGPLLDRFLAFLSSVESAAGEAARSRSVALWIDAPDAGHGALGRAALRLQVEDVQRPSAALRHLADVGRADELARRASAAVDSGRYERALELADRALDGNIASALGWMARGRAFLFRAEEDSAEAAFQRMLEVNPYLIHALGDVGSAAGDTLSAAGGPLRPPRAGDRPPQVREGFIPYRPRLLLRLDVYRRAFFRDVEFPEMEEEPEPGDPEDGRGSR